MGRSKSYKSSHVCITGGSDGLGFALAKLFTEEGANVSLIARTVSKLQRARTSLEQLIEQRGLQNRVYAFDGDCTQFTSVTSAVERAVDVLGPVDVLIANAGTAAPGRFVDLPITDFESQIRTNYLGTVHSVKTVVDDMVSRESGEIVIISSALGIIGMTGYSAYAPTKWALRGFADCLRMEMQAFNVSVRIAYPPDMQTTGYAAEVKRTPEEVKDMMEAAGDTVFSPEDVAKAILNGMKQGKYHLPSPDTLQTLSQSAMTGLSPGSFFLPIQAVINFICTFLFYFFCRTFDRITAQHARQRKQKK